MISPKEAAHTHTLIPAPHPCKQSDCRPASGQETASRWATDSQWEAAQDARLECLHCRTYFSLLPRCLEALFRVS